MSQFTDLLAVMREHDGGYEKMAEVVAVLDGTLTQLHKAQPQVYDTTITELEKLAYSISQTDAEKIVKRMEPNGQNWSYQQVKEFVEARGVDRCFVHWYLVMNMVYNDYYNTAKLYGLQDDVEFYYSMAKDFIDDPDAKPMKVDKYFSA